MTQTLDDSSSSLSAAGARVVAVSGSGGAPVGAGEIHAYAADLANESMLESIIETTVETPVASTYASTTPGGPTGVR